MNEVRARIVQNLEGRVSPVGLHAAINGVEERGIVELKEMVRDRIVETVNPFGCSRDPGGLYRLTITWTNRNINLP